MKELHTGAYYWNTFQAPQKNWPKLEKSLSTKVLIVGGGMSGLTTAYMLHQQGIEFVLVEGNEIAEGTSLISTGLLQYSNDIMLSDLRSAIGRNKADTFYKYCYGAMGQLQKMADTLLNTTGDVQFQPRSSMQYASTPQDVAKLQQEYNALSQLGLPCELWGRTQIEQHFPFTKGAGLLTHGDAEVNPYLCVSTIAHYLTTEGCQLYEKTIVQDHTKVAAQQFLVTVDGGHHIKAEYIIYAIGYQPQQLQQKLLDPVLNRSYVIVTNSIPEQSLWYEKMLLWETARPYLYVRTTEDSRIIIGGLDEKQEAPNYDDHTSGARYYQLLHEAQALFPHYDISIDFAWNGTFAETADQLPYLGVDPSESHIMYVLGYGGNGTVYSMLGAELAVHAITQTNEMNDLAEIVKLDR